MSTGFQDSLKGLKLECGVEGVRKLEPQKRIAKEFTSVPDEHLHIVVKRPRTGQLK